MLPKIDHHPTNWIDGMKITRQHFVDSENALLDMMRDSTAASLTAYNYGLLEPLPGEKSSLDCDVIQNQTKTFKIAVRHCRAVTAGGCRIEILPGMHPEIYSDHESSSASSEEYGAGRTAASSYLAVISVNPFIRQPFGAAAAEEYPPRNQYAISTCRLSLVAETEIDTASIGAAHLPVARFTLQGGELVRDAQYVPPCAVIAAHPGARQIYNEVADQLGLIQQYSTGILRKILDGAQDAPLARNLRKICEQCVQYISYEFFSFRTIYRQQSPVNVADCVMRLANLINVCTILMPVKEKEELLQYFNYWNGISPGRFEEATGAVINAEYAHENLWKFFQPLIAYLKMWSDLLEKLLELKLIGQRKEGFDFGGRTMERTQDKGKGKFSLMD